MNTCNSRDSGDQAILRMLRASPDTHAEREAPSGDPLGGVD